MKWDRKLFIVVLSLILLVLLVNFGLNFWIKRQLPHIINENNDSPYHISYKHIDVGLLERNLIATDIILVPKSSLNKKKDQPGLYAKVKSIEVRDYKLWDIIFSNKIKARSLIISDPEATLFKDEDQPEEKDKKKSNDYFSKIIYVSDIFLNRGNFKMLSLKKGVQLLKVSNLSFQVEGILVTDETLSRKLPFTYENYSVRYDSVNYRMNKYYHLKSNAFAADTTKVTIEKLRIIPLYGRKSFVKIIPAEKDLYKVSVAKATLSNPEWGYKKNDFYFDADALTIDNADADIYRSKIPPDDMKKKKLFNKLLREMKFDLSIDTLKIRNSKIVYEEESNPELGPGKLTFGRFNMTALNINSGFKKSKLPDVNIHIRCRFMDVSPFRVDWSFNVMDKSDGFHIKGSIHDMPAKNLAAFTKPYKNLVVEGDLDEVYFDYRGNEYKSRGTFGINYDDLKVKIYKKKDPKKKNKLLSAIANLFVKNDTKERVKSTQIDVDRVREKSFFNLLWRSTEEGLKKILL